MLETLKTLETLEASEALEAFETFETFFGLSVLDPAPSKRAEQTRLLQGLFRSFLSLVFLYRITARGAYSYSSRPIVVFYQRSVLAFL